MFKTRVFCIFVAFCLHAGLCIPVNLNEEVHVQLIGENSASRSRREAPVSNLPEELVFHLSGREDIGHLRLRKSPLLRVVTSEGPRDIGFVHNASVYTDIRSGAAMIVRRDDGKYQLTGTLNSGSSTYDIKPLERHTRDAGETEVGPNHVMTAIHTDDEVINFGTDVFTDPSHPDEIINIIGENNSGDRKKRAALHNPAAQKINKYAVELSRQKRAATLHTVEIAMVVDFTAYTAWSNYLKTDPIQEMNLWYTYVAEGIRIRYESIVDADIAITTTVSVLRILTNDADDDFLEAETDTNNEFPGFEGLQAFSNWVRQQPTMQLPVSDHYMLFTRFKPIGATGVAFAGRVCTFVGVSISQDTFHASIAGIAAHELGHSLNATHDDLAPGSCFDADQFIMSAVLSTPVDDINAGHPWLFSNCSVDTFKKYLSSVECTLPEQTNAANELPAPVSGSEAGQILSRDEQCRRSFRNSSSFFCESLQRSRPTGIEGLCGGMWCDIPTDEIGFCSTILPQEYTPCNDNKWCVGGVCVEMPTTTTTTTTTPVPTTTPEPTTTTSTTTTSITTITTTTTPEPTTTPTTTTTTTPEPTTTSTTTTTTTPEPTTTSTTTTTTTPEPTTTSTTTTITTPEPTTTSTTTTTPTPEPTTTPTTTTTTTPEPTTTPTTTTITTPEPTTTSKTTTTTTPEPTTTSKTTTTTTPEPTTTSTTNLTPKPTASTTAITTSTTQSTTTSKRTTTTTTAASTDHQKETTTSSPTTTTPDPRPRSFRDCISFWYKGNYQEFVNCLRSYLERVRDEQQRTRQEDIRRKQEEQSLYQEEKKKNNEEEKRKQEEEKQKEQEQKKSEQYQNGHPQSSNRRRPHI